MNILRNIKDKVAGGKKDPVIEFITKEEYIDAIPAPEPASKYIPQWYRNLDKYYTDDNQTTNERPGIQQQTVKGCMPFLEALTLGWILPNVAEVHTKYIDPQVQFYTHWDDEYIIPHSKIQLDGYDFDEHETIIKFKTPWYIKAPKNTRMLITDPFNRKRTFLHSFSGVRHVDRFLYNIFVLARYDVSPNHDRIIPDGYPLAQMVFFNNDGVINNATVRPMTSEEITDSKKTKNRMNTHESYYRENLWDPVSASRNISPTKSSLNQCPFSRSKK
jgi:hypothetical protein